MIFAKNQKPGTKKRNFIPESAQLNDNSMETVEAIVAKVMQNSLNSSEQMEKKLLSYLETYSRRANLKFDGINGNLWRMAKR